MKKNNIVLLFISVLMLSSVKVSFGQTDELISKEELNKKKNEYKKILISRPDDIGVQLKYIGVLFDLKEWGAIETYVPGILKKYPDNKFAHYVYAIAEREIGKFRAPVLRIISFKKSEKHFKKLAEIDSLYRDVYFQWALLKRIEKEYIEAVELTKKQLQITPRETEMRRKIFHFYDYFLEHLSPDSCEKYLVSQNTYYDKYALGELYRRNKILPAADSLFHALLYDHGEIEIQPVLLSIVRLRIQQDRYKEAEKYYWMAVDSIKTKTEADLVTEELIYIVHPEEYKALKGYKNFDELKEIIRYMWTKRNLMPAMEYNSRLIEHYKRLITAEENYRYDGLRHVLQKSDKVNEIKFPPWYYENYKFNDLGLIYIRYGKPDDEAIAFGSGMLPNKSWLYRKRRDRNKLIFHFYVAKDAPPDYWTLKPMLNFVGELENLYDWDTKYFTLAQSLNATQNRLTGMDLDAMGRGQGSAVSASSYIGDLKTDRLSDVDFAMKHDEQRFSKSTTVLPMFNVANMFKRDDKRVLTEFSYSISKKDLFRKIKKDTVSFEAGITVFDKHMKEVYKKLKKFKLGRKEKNKLIYRKQFIDSFKFSVYPGDYNIAIHCRIPQTEQLNGSRFQYSIPGFSESKLQLSTLMLAYDIKPINDTKSRYKSDLKIVPNPSLKFRRKDLLFVYYEVYNLKKGENGKTNYTVTFSIKQNKNSSGKKVLGIFGSSQSYTISVKNSYSGKKKNDSNYISFDISRAGKGDYIMEIVIRDNENNNQAKQSVKFIII
ncbi:hypothetical protein DRQ07_02050 [candidate division KSB1 bacterium]|nr:MAG: hypothetical protein DRQ07_02050 [candidate division KSB1 bacterium]